MPTFPVPQKVEKKKNELMNDEVMKKVSVCADDKTALSLFHTTYMLSLL